jgi:hypothetical protein
MTNKNAGSLPLNKRPALFGVRNAQNAIDLSKVERIKKYDIPRSMASKNLLPKRNRAFEARKNGKCRLGRQRTSNDRREQYENKARAERISKSHDITIRGKN